MPRSMSERLTVLEQRRDPSGAMMHYRIMPAGLTPTEKEAWHLRETAPLRRLGKPVITVELVRSAA